MPDTSAHSERPHNLVRAGIKPVGFVGVALIVATVSLPIGAYAKSPAASGREEPVATLEAGADALGIELADTASRSSARDFDKLAGWLSSPAALDRERDHLGPDFLEDSDGCDLVEMSPASKSDSEQDREEYRPRMGRRRRLLGLEGVEGPLARHLRTSRGPDSGQLGAQREILLL
jgi:hypothetical protein